MTSAGATNSFGFPATQEIDSTVKFGRPLPAPDANAL
jgi:hypothetical protein